VSSFWILTRRLFLNLLPAVAGGAVLVSFEHRLDNDGAYTGWSRAWKS
jgi:hypothetical protein